MELSNFFMVLVSLAAVGAEIDLHILHQYCNCAQRNGETVISWADAYDGQTILYYDTDNKSFVATQPFAQFSVDERNANVHFLQSLPQQIVSLCERIERLAFSINATLERKAPTYTRAFVQKKLGQNYLVCSVKGFFPRDIKVSWVRDGEVVDSGPETTDVVPQSDGTFQVRNVRPLNEDRWNYACQVEHKAISGKLLIPLEHNVLIENEALIIIGAVLGILGICTVVVTAILYSCLLNDGKKLSVHPTAKFTNQTGLCRSNMCSGSVRSATSNTSNSSGSSADGLTKSSA